MSLFMTKRYVPDLRQLHSLAERNYAALKRLLPETSDQMAIQIGNQLQFEIGREQEARYTTDVRISQTAPDVADYLKARFLVRLYHDAQMAEIIDFQGQARLTAITPNVPSKYHQHDEKLRLSLHLSAWLTLCARQGRAKLEWQCLSL